MHKRQTERKKRRHKSDFFNRPGGLLVCVTCNRVDGTLYAVRPRRKHKAVAANRNGTMVVGSDTTEFTSAPDP